MIPRQFSDVEADRISKGVFLIGLGILFFTNLWWPGILLVILASIFAQYFFSGHLKEIIISAIGILALWLISYYNLSAQYLIPTLFVLFGAGLIFFTYYWKREY